MFGWLSGTKEAMCTVLRQHASIVVPPNHYGGPFNIQIRAGERWIFCVCLNLSVWTASSLIHSSKVLLLDAHFKAAKLLTCVRLLQLAMFECLHHCVVPRYLPPLRSRRNEFNRKRSSYNNGSGWEEMPGETCVCVSCTNYELQVVFLCVLSWQMGSVVLDKILALARGWTAPVRC